MESVSNTPTTPGRRHGCGRCEARWTGANISHCGGCHHTFGGLSSFDRHRHDYACLDPATVGLVRNERGTWGASAEGVDFAKVFGKSDD